MSALLIDVGNTNFKWCLRGGDGREGVASSGVACRQAVAEFSDRVTPERIALACVKSSDYQQEMVAALRDCFSVEPYVARVTERACGVINSYAEPARMGIDRWLAMIAVRQRIPSAFCVVDCGSAVTIDWVAENGRHLGGFILAGLRLSIGALLSGTDQVIVDYDKLDEADIEPGASTTDAVYNGALFALVSQVESAYAHLQHVAGHEQPGLVLTGGDAELVSRHLQCPNTIMKGLVFDGLEVMMNEAGAH